MRIAILLLSLLWSAAVACREPPLVFMAGDDPAMARAFTHARQTLDGGLKLAAEKPSMEEQLRSVQHGNGLFSFEVPPNWEQQVDEDGSQVFWVENAGSGTLRVTAVTARKESDPSSLPQTASALLSAGAEEIHLRDDGVAWVHYRREEEEDGERTLMFWWEFAQFVPPSSARIAFFSFTIYADEEEDASTKEQLAVLHRLPSTLRFGPLQPFETHDGL
jgi:hypothetical protein